MIADQLDDAGINALARTNSQMYDLLNEFLYRRDVTRELWRLPASLTWVLETGAQADIYTNTVEWAVYACRNFNPIPENLHGALQEAAKRGCAHLVERLLKVNGINPNYGGPTSAPPLVLAALNGHSAVVELLLATVNIDPNIRDLFKATPLHYACRKRHRAVKKQLLARDDIDLNDIGPLEIFKKFPSPTPFTCFS
jgi:hypothetical protein